MSVILCMTSSFNISDFKRSFFFENSINSPSFVVIAIILLELEAESLKSFSLAGPRGPNKPGLDRVNVLCWL